MLTLELPNTRLVGTLQENMISIKDLRIKRRQENARNINVYVLDY